MKQSVRHAVLSGYRAGLRAAGSTPLTAILIMGHMRCGSTLLLHILMTHPKIVGCGERNAHYRSEDDLDRFAIAARVSRRAFFRPLRYAVDQINHDHFTPNEALLRHPRVRLLFLIREPAASLRSVVSLTKTFYEAWPVAKATNYYVQRLSTLARYAEMLPPEGRALALTYQDLTDNTPATFARLQAFLGRDTGFSEHYDLQEFTGKRGDPSENIRTGRIVRDRATAPVEIPPAEIERASVAFEACHHALERLR